MLRRSSRSSWRREPTPPRHSLAAAVLELADEARRVVDRIQRARVTDFPRLAGELDVTNSYAVKRMQTALDDLRAEGYDLGTIGTS